MAIKSLKCICILSVSLIFFSEGALVFAKGVCTQSDKKKVMYRTNYRFAEDWDKCGRRNFGSTKGTVECIQERYPALSNACADCLGAMTACSKKHCSWECLTDSRSEDCQECAREYCRPELIECTGIRDEALPHFSPKPE